MIQEAIMKKTLKFVCSSVLTLCSAAGVLAGCGEKTNDSEENSEFTWSGMTDATVVAGTPFDLLDGVKVTNAAGEDISSSVTVLTLDENEAELTELDIYDDYDDFDYHITGVYTVYYMAVDDGVKDFESREITVEQQYNLSNGDFAVESNDGFYGWQLDIPGGKATMEKVTENGVKKPKFNITGLGNAWYSMQYMSSVNLLEGETYKITVNAKSDSGKSVSFGFENPSTNYSMMQGLTPYKLSSEYADYVSYYTADKDYTNAKAVLYFGYILEEDTTKAYDVTINSIKIEKVQRCGEVTFEGLDSVTYYAESEELKEFIANPKAGVTAKSGDTDLTDRITVMGQVSEQIMEGTNYTLAYVVENENGPSAIGYRSIRVRLQKEHPYSLSNGTFDNDIKYWTQDVNAQNPGKATFEWVEGDEKEGAAKITIENPSTDGWHIQFRQDVSMEKNTNYIIKIRAKASRNRSMNLELNAGTNYSYAIDLTTEYTVTEIYYSAPNNTTGFRFLLGGGGSENNGSVIWIDYAEITLDPDTTKYEGWQLKNSDFEYGMRHWGSEGSSFVEGSDDNGTYVSTTFAEDTGADWNIQLRQDGKQFEAGKTYKLIVKASSTVDRNIKVEINPNQDSSKGKNTTFALTEEVKTFEFEFSFDEAASGTRVGMLLGGSGIKGSTVKIYQFEIVEVSADA